MALALPPEIVAEPISTSTPQIVLVKRKNNDSQKEQ